MPLILFNDREPTVYKLADIYDPAVDGSDPEKSGKFVPAVGSVVLDMSVPIDHPIPAYSVVAVDETTYASTLRPLTSLIEIDAIPDRVMSYGNDILMLYYDDRTNPTSLRIDSNLLLIGDNSAEYILYKTNQTTGLDEPISLYIDANNHPQGERVPIVETATPGTRRCVDCFTSVPLVDNDKIKLKIFDAVGVQIMEVELITKRSTILNDLASSMDVVTGFDVRANQEKPTGEFILYRGQNKDDLAIFPELEFSTGEKLIVPIDNAVSFMYGWEDIKTDMVGCEYDLLFKYYLTDHLLSTIASGGDVRFVTATKTIIVENIDQVGYTKISIIPYFDNTVNEYRLKFFAYYQTRGGFEDVTSKVAIIGPALDMTSVSYGVWQSSTLRVPMDDGLGNLINFDQDFMIQFNAYHSNENWLIKKEDSSVLVYGANDGTHNRPVLRYDSSYRQYFFATSDYINKDKFLEFFYTNAEPPCVGPNESTPPIPTHFTIREMNQGSVILPDVIPIESYDQLMSLITLPTHPDQYNDTVVVVEFLKEETGGYQVLYGVPVDTLAGNYVPN